MDLWDLYEEHELFARAAARSRNTIDSYKSTARGFIRYLTEQEQSTDCEAITTRIVREYVTGLQASHTPQTVAKKLQVLKTLFAFGVREELLANDPTKRVAAPKVPQTDFEVFDTADVDTLLQACSAKSLTGVRDAAIVWLLFDSGIRASELVSIPDDAIDWQRGLIRVYGKGAKERQVPVSARTLRAIRRYLTKRKEAGYPESDTLFVNQYGDRLTRYGLNQLLERLGARTGLHANPHKFRHSFAVHALRNDAREYDIQDCLGHTSLTMTKRYARQTGEDLARQHKRFSPADRLKVRC